ncbi:hypothetical protein G6549_23545 [Bacillus sp. MM2020_1]|nr:hypothetical protein [Bacillus sp. MM2020_1]
MEEITAKNGLSGHRTIWTIAKGGLPIPGTKRVNYLEENVEAVNIDLTEEELEQLEKISPLSDLPTSPELQTP